MTGSLDGRSIVVTGGGSGIGASCAEVAAAAGAVVTICGRTESKLTATAERISAAGGSVEIEVADVTVEDDVARLMAAANGRGNGLVGVVANAGGGGMLGPYHTQDVDGWLQTLHLNVLSTMLCIKHSVPHMARAGGGSFIGMSSIAGHVTHSEFGAYPPAKAAIESMVKNAADEYGQYGLRFNAIQPGFIATEIMEGIPRGGEVWNSYIENTPMGDVGEPDDIGNLARFLLSDEGRWITGATIPVDGGHALRCGPNYRELVQMLVDPATLDPRA